MKPIHSAVLPLILALAACTKAPDVTGTYQTKTYSASAITDPMTGQQIAHTIEHSWTLSIRSDGKLEFASEDGTSFDEGNWKIDGTVVKFIAQPPHANGPSMSGLNLDIDELKVEPNGDLISSSPSGGNSLRWNKQQH